MSQDINMKIGGAMAQTIPKNIAQQIVEAVKDVCEHDINFIDMDGMIFASTNLKRIGDYHEIGHKVARSGESIEVETDDSFLGTQKGVNIPFLYKGEICAVIGITGIPSEVRKFAYLSHKLTNLILREHELDAYERIQKTQLNHIIRTIVHHGCTNQPYLTDFLKKYQIDQRTDYRTLIVKIDSHLKQETAALNIASIEKSIFRAFEQTGSPLYTFNYPNEYILLIEQEQFQKWFYLFRTLTEKYFPAVKIGIGNFVPLSRQQYSYDAAKIALHSLFGEECLAVFDELDLEILLGNLTEDVKAHFLKQTISCLSADEQELLKAYFSTNMSLKETCEQIFMHKNTLQYKLDKIARDTGYNPRRFKEAVVLYIALKIHSIL